MLRKLATSLAIKAHVVRDALRQRREKRCQRLWRQYASLAGGEVGQEPGLDWCSQIITWFQFTEKLCEHDAMDRRGWDWIISQEGHLWKEILQAFDIRERSQWDHDLLPVMETPENLSLLFELFLACCDQQHRRRHGAFFTPPEVARWLVEQVDRALRADFPLPQGLADGATWSDVEKGQTTGGDEPFVRILDPAAGSGVFLVAAIDRIYSTLVAHWRESGHSDAAIRRRWNRFVPEHLLPRLFGLELSPAACLAAHLEIAQKLANTGYSFAHPARVQVYTANTLAGPNDRFTSHMPMTVILGNPPFAALSQNRSRWIEGLLHGRTENGEPTASYFEVDGRPLAERKHWLHDDYVKFLRYAQWRIEQAGCGVVGLVTNHSYLDNPTFRGVRRQLMQAFSNIDVVDLHGNRKKRETAPDGWTDENLFSIEQGVALSVLVRRPWPLDETVDRRLMPLPEEGPARQAGPTQVRHAELWGGREAKRRRMAEHHGAGLTFKLLSPTPPFYFFAPRDESLRDEYQRGWRLTDVFPVYVAAPVTARDGLVVAFSREELLERIAAFRDLSIPDANIRERYFPAPRTSRYPRGDTRSWKLPEARRRLAACDDWQAAVRRCLYRPFDRRWIYWSETMIDWPRREVMRHLETRGNLALVARRQMPPTEPCRYFWATDEITLDGVIRSDNRGGESLFPLLLLECNGSGDPGRVRINLADGFFSQAAAIAGLPQDAAGAVRVFHYLYALVHATSYRERYAAHLRIDFPRVFLPRDGELFFAMSERGAELVGRHVLGQSRESLALPSRKDTGLKTRATEEGMGLEARVTGTGPWRIESGFPRYERDTVYLNRDASFHPVVAAAWEWRVGGHQVCRKWLKDRRKRILTKDELATYGAIVAAARETSRLSAEIDRVIARHGGWPAAFLGRQASS